MTTTTDEASAAYTKPNKTATESLRYRFSENEITEIARKQADHFRERAILEEEKKRVANQYKTRIETIESEIEGCTESITTGYEIRQVECNVYWHRPERGMKTLIRLDTLEIVRVAAMSEHERVQAQQMEIPLEPLEDKGWKMIRNDGLPDKGVDVKWRDRRGHEWTASLCWDPEKKEDYICDDEGNTWDLEDAIAWRHLTAEEAGDDAE